MYKEYRLVIRTIVETSCGQEYLKKLCRHFAHKVPVILTKTQGRIELPFGPCRIKVDARKMHLSIEINDNHQAEEAEKTLEKHLLRIANLKQLEIKWHRELLNY